MRFTHLKLRNWKNFPKLEVPLSPRTFIYGPNASGKSNLLDVFRFLRDIAREEGGLQRAVQDRSSFSAVRSLHAHGKNMHVEIDVRTKANQSGPEWRYFLSMHSDPRKRVRVKEERVELDGHVIDRRPSKEDRRDPDRLRETHLESLRSNHDFRSLAEGFASVDYIHLVPQLVRRPGRAQGASGDPFGSDFLERVARATKRERSARLGRINKALQIALPQFDDLQFERDEVGRPHLKARYVHWRPKGSWQQEDQFSDGTLRLFALLWELAEPGALLLLEEPELSLHSELVRQLPQVMGRVATKSKQIIVSSHSLEMLNDPGVDPSEIIMLEPDQGGTQAYLASSRPEVVAVAKAGGDVGPLIAARTRPERAEQLALFGE